MNKNSNIFVLIVSLISFFILFYFCIVYQIRQSVLEPEELVLYLMLFPVLLTPVYAAIHGIREDINESRILKAKDRAKELNFAIENRIVGIKEITNLIEEDYKNEIKFRNLLQLIDSCSSNSDITSYYYSKAKEKNSLLFERIRDFSNKYHLDIGNDELSLEEVTEKCEKLKIEYESLMYNGEINKSNYQKINQLYKKYCMDNRSVNK